MSKLQSTYRTENKIPINRNNLFYSEEDFLFDTEIGKEYLEEDVNQTLILYQIDIEKSNLDTTYQESNKKRLAFKAPIELHVLYKIDKPQLMNYDKSKNLGVYVKSGILTFGVYQYTLDELECDIHIGDYVGVLVDNNHIEYFEIVNDGRNNFDNEHSVFGYKPSYRSITAAPVSDETEINS